MVNCYLLITNVYASGRGTTTAAFLKIGIGARNIAMGETGAVSEDVNSVYWNPAGLASINEREISLMHAVWLETINYEHLAFGMPTKLGAFGGAVNYLTMNPIDKYDNTGAKVNETFTATDLAVTLTYGRNIADFKEDISVDVGLNLKYIQSKIENESAEAYAADVGLQTELKNKKLSIGLAVQNIGTVMKFIRESDKLPLNIKLGSAYIIPISAESNPLTLALDLNYPNDNDIRINFGTEYSHRFGKDIKLSPRVGYRSNTKGLEGIAGLSAGVGLGFKSYSLDWAFVPYGELGDTHRVSVSIRF